MVEIDITFDLNEILGTPEKHLEKMEDLQKALSMEELFEGIYRLPKDDSSIKKKLVYVRIITEKNKKLIIVIRREDLYIVAAYFETHRFVFTALNTPHPEPPLKNNKARDDFPLDFNPSYLELIKNGKSVVQYVSLNRFIAAINGLCNPNKEDTKKKHDKKQHAEDFKNVSWSFSVILLSFAEAARFYPIQKAIQHLFKAPHVQFYPSSEILTMINNWEHDGSLVQSNTADTENYYELKKGYA